MAQANLHLEIFPIQPLKSQGLKTCATISSSVTFKQVTVNIPFQEKVTLNIYFNI